MQRNFRLSDKKNLKKNNTALTVVIKLKNTTGGEDIQRLVNFCFEPLSHILSVDSFKQKNEINSERAKEITVQLNLTWVKTDNDIYQAMKAIKNAISSHWQCKFHSFIDAPEHLLKQIQDLSLDSDSPLFFKLPHKSNENHYLRRTSFYLDSDDTESSDNEISNTSRPKSV